MFAVGDMHASMGDGEVCFTGVEIAGEVDIRFDLQKGKQGTWPVTQLPDRWLPHATADDYDEALRLVSEEAARFLVDEWGFSIEDAFIFLSVACDAGVAQACKPARDSARSRASPYPRSRQLLSPSAHDYNSESDAHDEPGPRVDLMCGRCVRGDHRREVDGPSRARPLRRCTPLLRLEHSCAGISPRTLSERLRALEDEGLVLRRSYAESPPRVEYELTEKGDALLPIIEEMRRFGQAYLTD